MSAQTLPQTLPAIAALTFHANRDAETWLADMNRGRRAGTPIGPHAEQFKARLRADAGRTPTHRREQES